jgi:hypothetical protein
MSDPERIKAKIRSILAEADPTAARMTELTELVGREARKIDSLAWAVDRMLTDSGLDEAVAGGELETRLSDLLHVVMDKARELHRRADGGLA